MIIFITLVFLILCIVFSAFLSASETALFSLSPFTVKSYSDEKKGPKSFIVQLLSKPKDLLVSILMLNVLSNILIQNVFSSLFQNTENFFVLVGIPLLIVLILGEIIPKSLAFYHNQKIAYFVSPILFPITRFLAPFRHFLTSFTEILAHPFFLFLNQEKPLSLKELQDLLELSNERNILEKEEQELLSNYLNFQTLFAKEKMVPREELYHFDLSDDLNKIPKLFQENQVTRLLVCEKSLDSVKGILTLNAYLKYRKKIRTKENLLSICHPSFFVPETIKAYALLKQMDLKKESLALLVDEYGSLQGLLTDQDLISYVVGEEKEIEEKISALYTVVDKNAIVASGRLDLITFEKIFKIPLESKTGATTIAGWLIEQMEDIPLPGTKWQTKDFLFYVIDASPSRVKKIYIRRVLK